MTRPCPFFFFTIVYRPRLCTAVICTLLENAFSFPLFIFYYRHLCRGTVGEHLKLTCLGRPLQGQPRRALQRTSRDLIRGRHFLTNKLPSTSHPPSHGHDHTHCHSSSPHPKPPPPHSLIPHFTPTVSHSYLANPCHPPTPAPTPTPTHRGYTFTSAHTHDSSVCPGGAQGDGAVVKASLGSLRLWVRSSLSARFMRAVILGEKRQ